jgi:hypothetical protein
MTSIVDSAVAAAREGDPERFKECMAAISNDGWERNRVEISEQFVEQVSRVAPESCTLDDIERVAWRSYDHTAKFIRITPYDIEFAIRAFAGAKPLMESFPVDMILTIAVALTGTWDRPEWQQEST